MEKGSLIRTIYLYLFALLGLILLIISGIHFLDLGLRAFVFTQAEKQQKINYMRPPTLYSLEKLESLKLGDQGLSKSEKLQVQQMIQSYQKWKKQTEKVNPIISQRQREASSSLAMILIGLPLYFYHWTVIKKERS